MPTLAGMKHLSVQFFFHKPHFFYSDRNGHQGGYSRADTLNNNLNKRSKGFSITGNY